MSIINKFLPAAGEIGPISEEDMSAAESFAVAMTVYEYVADGLDLNDAIKKMAGDSCLSVEEIAAHAVDHLVNDLGVKAEEFESAATRALIIETVANDGIHIN